VNVNESRSGSENLCGDDATVLGENVSVGVLDHGLWEMTNDDVCGQGLSEMASDNACDQGHNISEKWRGVVCVIPLVLV
jgi:hypothetical protein